jgi:hypothetical protein
LARMAPFFFKSCNSLAASMAPSPAVLAASIAPFPAVLATSFVPVGRGHSQLLKVSRDDFSLQQGISLLCIRIPLFDG